MHHSRNSSAKYHEMKHFLAALDKLGEVFGHNRDTYYSLGRHFDYTDLLLLILNLTQTLCPRYYVIQLFKSSLTISLNFYLP